jgi:lipoprotein-releasing system ATP-binding protein
MIELRNIHKSFGTLEVLKGIDLTVGEAELVSIVGSSGAGKTTLLQIMGTLDAPSQGDVFIDGEHVNNLSEKRLAHLRNTKIGFVFQFHQLLPEFSALENVMIPSLVSGADRKEAEKRAGELLDMMGLSERMAHRPNELSGGEKQRVAVARALVNRPTVVLADEPSGSLDTHNKEELHRLFARLRDELHQTFVIVTHDETLSRQSDRIIRLSDGRIV